MQDSVALHVFFGGVETDDLMAIGMHLVEEAIGVVFLCVFDADF